MKLEVLLDMKLKDILENYCCINNLECGYYYGVCSMDDVDKLFEKYNVEEYSEAFSVENLVNDEIIVSFDDEILSYDKLEKIMRNLGITEIENILK